MKLTVIKDRSTLNNKEGLTPGYIDKLYLDDKELKDITGYKISRGATMAGYEVTLNMIADVEIKEKELTEEEKSNANKNIQNMLKEVFNK